MTSHRCGEDFLTKREINRIKQDYLYIAQFGFFKIQPKTIDLSTRLREINYRVCGVCSLEPCSDVYCFRLNIKISKLGY